MNKTRLSSWAAVGVLWLGMSVGCQKEPPEPDPEPACPKGCCSDVGELAFAARLDGLPLKYVGLDVIELQETVTDKVLFDGKPKQIRFGIPCTTQAQEQLVIDFMAELRKDPKLSVTQYKIWGIAYDSNSSTYIPDRIYAFKITRFERIQ
jgi:hypothetical protein